MSQLQQSSLRNRLLRALSPEDFLLLQPHLEPVQLELKDILFDAGEAVRHAYFVEQGIVSLLASTQEGRIEIGMIGPEGMVGTPVILATERSVHTNMVQAKGEALRIPADELRLAVRQSTTLSDVLLRYVHFLLTQTAQTAYANAEFNVESRLARWILMTHDRLEDDELPLTHEFLALMLGVRRAGVTVATHVLEGNGLIRAKRGLIVVRDRGRLEELAGESYGVAEAEYERLMAPA